MRVGYFGNGVVANRVAQKLNDDGYECLGQFVRSAIGTRSPGSYNSVAWTIKLNDLPSNATSKDVEEAKFSTENFYLTFTFKEKRVKAVAWFQDEADARSACSLNDEPLAALGGGKLTVTLVQSVKIKIFRGLQCHEEQIRQG